MMVSIPISTANLEAVRRALREVPLTGTARGKGLDPETLGMVNRFEELEAAANETPLGEHVAGELIASEIEVKTGKSWETLMREQLFKPLGEHYPGARNGVVGNHHFAQANTDSHPGLNTVID